jgi:hypothetical protein
MFAIFSQQNNQSIRLVFLAQNKPRIKDGAPSKKNSSGRLVAL